VSAALAAAAALAGTASAAPETALKLEKGDHICLIGNTLAERMQHDGWLETYFQSRRPQEQLAFRNLSVSADELTLRTRVDGFGSPDEWLTKEKADVVFAFFGYNESFAGPQGLDKYKKDLAEFIKHTLEQKYNGKSAPQLVLFSSIAQEKIASNPNFPDNAQNNKNIKLYSDATAEVAKAGGAIYVDLYLPTVELYGKASKPLTIDCIHLTDEGDKHVAQVIADTLLPGSASAHQSGDVEKLRQAVLDKDLYWFWRYRTNDGFNVYGGRSHNEYQSGDKKVSNRTVLQREMEVLDVMTENRDKRIWAVASGGDVKVDDSNTPPFIPIQSNKPADKITPYLSGEEAIKHMKLAPGLKVELVASEETNPDLVNPIQMTFDTKGRLWVACTPNYPHWRPKDPMTDKIIIFDLKDGKAVKETVFADHLNMPTGLEFWKDGVIVAQSPDILFLKDTTGGDHCNSIEHIVEGRGDADTHHSDNSMGFDPGGAVYFQEGTFNRTHTETLDGPIHCDNGGVYRYEPITHKFEAYVSYGFANPHGHVWDYWGNDFVTDGTGNVNYFGAGFSGHVDYPKKHGGYQPYFKQHYRPCPATGIISSRHFPESMQGNLMDVNVIGFQGIGQYKVTPSDLNDLHINNKPERKKKGEKNAAPAKTTSEEKPKSDHFEVGSGFVGTELEPLIQSDDPNFRPSSAKIGPDGAIYVLDWQNTIIGHLQHNLRDPNRDHSHGRIYRITYEGRPLLTPPQIFGQPVEHLLDLLKEYEDGTRYRAKIELSKHDAKEVIPALEKWISGLDKNDKNYQHNLLEGLWVYQWNNVVNEPLLRQLLASPDYRARAAATRVLCYWRDRVQKPLELLNKLAADESPRVRLEAVRAASFFKTPDAVDVALESADKKQDYYLKYTLDETLKTLDKYNKK
jgi:glucose/arabinose dehydrogenase